ncbi:MAG: hypothetical protein WC322_03400 [Candidatus Paceibacterota bacterium]|jgi:hypothetical protein
MIDTKTLPEETKEIRETAKALIEAILKHEKMVVADAGKAEITISAGKIQYLIGGSLWMHEDIVGGAPGRMRSAISGSHVLDTQNIIGY